MKYQNFFHLFKYFSLFNIVNYYIPRIESKLISLLSFKKKAILQNSFQDNTLLERFFGKEYSYKQLSAVFFNNFLFKYVNPKEKPKIVSILRENCNNEVNRYIKEANQILNKEITIFGVKTRFKDQIDWFYGFDGDYHWNSKRTEIMDVRPSYKGHNVDVKYVWELNRHQFLPYLGFAYYITGDEKYSKAFTEIVSDWIRKNPTLYGINWVSGLEISIRMISWIFSLYFFRDSKEILNENFFMKILNALVQHAYYLKNFYTLRSFNHTVGELFGVYLFSRIFDSNPHFKKWEKRFYKLFNKQIKLQVRTDGINIEQSICYHKFVLEFFSLFLMMNPELKKGEEGKSIEKMFIYLMFTMKPNYKFPLIGDNDDGKVLLLTMKEEYKFFDLLILGANLYESKELKFITRERISPISILLLGTPNDFKHPMSASPITNWIFFEHSGYIIAKDNWKSDANYLFVDFGRFGPRNAPHSHSDITNLIYSYNGKEILVDSGVFSYNRSLNERNSFRSSEAHNVLTIDHQNQAIATKWFVWESKPRIKRKVGVKDSKYDLSCSHDGYNGFIVTRNIILNESIDEIIIRDEIRTLNKSSKQEEHDINLFFHFAKDLNVQIVKNSLIIDGKLILTIQSSFPFTLKLEKSYFAPMYGQKYENFRLNIHMEHKFYQQSSLQITSILRPISRDTK